MGHNSMEIVLSVVKNENYITININGRAGQENLGEFSKILPEISEGSKQNVIVNCEHLSDISSAWIRLLMQLSQKLKTANRQMRLIYVSPPILRILKQEGVENSLRAFDNLQLALEDLGQKTTKVLDVNFINPFLSATIKVLETQSSTLAKPGQIYTKNPKDKFLGDISGVIGLISDAFSGSVVISFPEKTFLKIISRMLGEEFTEINKDIQDGAGELTNIIFGQAKVLLNEQGFGVKTAIPSVVTGNDHSILSLSSGPRVVVPFETDVGPFFIEICLSS